MSHLEIADHCGIEESWKKELIYIYIIQGDAVITRSVFFQIFTKSSHSSPVRPRYGVYFVDTNFDLYPASVTATLNAITHYIGSVIMKLNCKCIIKINMESLYFRPTWILKIVAWKSYHSQEVITLQISSNICQLEYCIINWHRRWPSWL